MKLTPEQKRGIEERFAVLQQHVLGNSNMLLTVGKGHRMDWHNKNKKDIEACRDEVLVLVERLECEPQRVGEEKP